MKTYIVFAVTFFLPQLLWVWLECFDVTHIVLGLVWSTFLFGSLYLMWSVLRWVVERLAK